MKRFRASAAAAVLAAFLLPEGAFAQATGFPLNAPTTNGSVSITTGLTYQTLLAAAPTRADGRPSRNSLTIQNNNASDACYLVIGTNQITAGTTTTSSTITIGGSSITAAKASIVLSAGQSYQRYFPYVPGDAIYATCATTGDSLYVDTQ